jgi:very-short-patch-repair endonuclease
MKRIAFLITSSGVDGREKTHIERAFWDEKARDESLEKDKNKNYYCKDEKIVDFEVAKKELLADLNGLDKLLLGIEG